MEREKFMQEARLTVHRILEGKENGIMNLVQQAWAEGKRNADVDTLWAAIDEALDRREVTTTMSPATGSCAEPVYPTWTEYFRMVGLFPEWSGHEILDNTPIPADLANLLGVEPKEVQNGTDQS